MRTSGVLSAGGGQLEELLRGVSSDSRAGINGVSKKIDMKAKKKKTTNPLIDALRLALAESYAVLAQTHLCHWNVRGPGFFALHTAFEEQYTELFTAVDEIAERIRALGQLAPGGLGSLAKIAGVEEIKENATAEEMVAHLRDINKALVKDLAKARDLAGEAEDSETEDMMIARIQIHQKTIWMLDSYLA